MTLSSLSNFITTGLGRMKAWATCNSLDWVTCFPLHFTLVYIEYWESWTRQVVYKHVHYGAHGEMYIGIDSRLIDLSLCCFIGSQIKKIGFWLPNQNYWYLVTRTSGSPPSGLRIAQMSGQFSWSLSDCPLNAATESGYPRSWKIAGSRGPYMTLSKINMTLNMFNLCLFEFSFYPRISKL